MKDWLINKATFIVFFLCCVSSLLVFADDRQIPLSKQSLSQVGDEVFQKTLEKIQILSGVNAATKVSTLKSPFQSSSAEAKVYENTNKRLERFITEINSYTAKLKIKAGKGGVTNRDISVLRRTFSRLSTIKVSVLSSLMTLKESISKTASSIALENIDALIKTVEENIKKLESTIAAITVKGTDLTATDFDALIDLTQQQTINQSTSDVNITPLELRAEAPDTSGTTSTPLTLTEIVGALAPPTAADLLETVEVQFTPEIVALAASLNNSPIEIYEYVRNKVDFDPYFGSRKGGAAALLTKNGNDYDQSSLLIALLRTSGIPAKYIRGTVEVPVQRVLDWLGLKDLNAPNTILNTAGINAVPVVGGGGLVEVYRIDRVWVAAYVPFGNYRGTSIDDTGKAWVPLDPAFNISKYQAGVDNITDSVPFDEAGYLSIVRTETAADFYRDQVFDYLSTNTPGTSLVDVPYAGTPIPQEFGIVPASLPYTVLSLTGEFSDIPGTLRHAARITVRVGGGTLLDATLLLPEVSLNRRTISFTAASAADQTTIDSFGGISNTPPFLVNVKPQLKVEGVLHTDGLPVSLGSGIAVDIGFILPIAGETDSVSHPFLTAGDFISVNLDVGQTNEELVNQRTEKLLAALETIGTPVPDAQQDEVTGEFLNIGGLLYWLRMNDANKLISGLYQYKEVLGVSESLTTSNMELLYLFDRPYAAMPGNLSLDAARLLHSRFSIDGIETDKADFNRLLGIESSAREHAMWEELAAVQSISTIKALQIAGQTGIPVHRFDSSTAIAPITCVADGSTDTVLNCMAKCGVSSFTRSSISTELFSGKEITTHECVVNLNQWNGVGYISADPTTQAGAYIISGGLNSVTETGAETTITGINPITQIDSQTGSQIIEQLLTHQITEDNVQELLHTLLLPTRLIKHIETLVGEGNTATVSEVLVEVHGRESLVYQLESDALTQSEYYRFDTLNGGAGTEDPPGSLGDPDGNTGNGDGTGMAGDPVNIANGSFYREERDFAITALGYPLAFDRFYSSSLTEDGSLGLGWTHTYSDRVIELADNSVTWIVTKGGSYTYLPDGSGGYITPQGIDSSLTKTATRFTLTSKKGEIQDFNLSGQMTARKNIIGQGVDLTYTSGLLTTVTDTVGRSLTFTYSSGKIATVSDFTGRIWTYSYTGGQLSRVQSPFDVATLPKVTEYSYYTGTLGFGLLKTITEPNGGIRRLRYFTNLRVYDVTDPEGGREKFAYDLLTNTTIFTDQRGNRTRYRHNDDGNIVEIRYPGGSRERWTWSNHQVVSHRDTLGYVETYQYDSNRNLTRHTDRMGLVTTYTYDPSLGVVTRMTRPGGRVFNYTYNANGILTRIDDPVGGRFTTSTINSLGLPDSATDPRGITTNNTYNTIGQQTGISVTGEYSASIAYTPLGSPALTTDANTHATILEYDLLDRLIRREDAEGNEMSLQYDAAGQTIKVTNERGYETLSSYDLNNRLITQTDALLNTIVHKYDLAGNLVKETDRLGRVTSHSYDNRNRRTSTTYPNSTVIVMQYDSENRLTAFTDPLGNKTSYVLDGNGRITNSTDALLNSTTQTYDINSNLQSVTNRRGGVTSYEYDLFNQLTMISGEGGKLATFDYDASGNRIQSAQYDISGLATTPTDPRTLASSRKRTINYINDVRGQPESITDPEGEVEQIIRDSKGNPTTIIDKRNKSTSYQYDLIDRVVKIIHPDITETNITYDENSNLTSITTPGSGVWFWTYDELDRVKTATDPLLRTALFEYDAVGNFIKQTNPNASTVGYSYDALNRRLHTARSDSTYTTLMYDNAGNIVFGETEKTILISTFDVLNRVSSEFNSIPKSGFSQQVVFGYDVESNLTSTNINKIGTLSYGYDLADRLTSVSNSADGSTVGVGYNGFGDRSTVNYGNGTVGNMSYDKLGRITQIDYGSSIAQTGYIRDADGNPTSINETIAGISEVLTVAYDDFGRPTSSTASTSPSRNETFSYDSNGNLTNTGVGNSVKYDAADQISYDGSSTFITDSQGNITQKNKLGGVLSDYTYDPENKLIHVRQTSGATVTNDFDNVYDAFDRLVETNANGVPIHRVYIGLNPAIDFNSDGSVNTQYTMGPAVDDIFAATISGTQHYLHRDPMGSVRATTDSSGLVTGTKNYSLYGRIQDQTGASNVLLGYTGRPFDPMTGLTDLRARWLDPEIARFTSRDPIPLRPIMPNPYAYADNKPLKYFDPLGLSPEDPGYSWLDAIQGGLEFGGLWPGVGIAPDLLNALVSGLRGNGLAALGHLGSAIPVAGQGVTAAKMADRAADAAKALKKADKARAAAKAKEATGKVDSALDGAKKKKKTYYSKKDRQEANKKAGGKCEYCGKKTQTEKPFQKDSAEGDHFDPQSKGGPTTKENLVNSCRECNGPGDKGAKTPGSEWQPKNPNQRIQDKLNDL